MNYTELLSFSVGTITRIAQGKATKGSLKWNTGGNITFYYLPAKAELVLSYVLNKTTPITQHIKLTAIPSNLHNGNTFFFICPITQKKCRKLYLYGNRFVSRFAIPQLYEKCNRSRKWRLFEKLMLLENLNTRYRKKFYKDKITPFGRKYFKCMETQEMAYSHFLNTTFNKTRKHNN